jgi:hypothetical protein
MKRALLSAVIYALFGAAISAEPLVLQVSVHELLAHPENYDGKLIKVTGYCHTSNEEISLYASKRADERSHDCDSSIWLDIFTSPPRNAAKDEDLSFKTVRVIGTFRYKPTPILDKSVPYEWRFRGFGSYKMWAREISEITFLQPVR